MKQKQSVLSPFADSPPSACFYKVCCLPFSVTSMPLSLSLKATHFTIEFKHFYCLLGELYNCLLLCRTFSLNYVSSHAVLYTHNTICFVCLGTYFEFLQLTALELPFLNNPTQIFLPGPPTAFTYAVQIPDIFSTNCINCLTTRKNVSLACCVKWLKHQ